MVTATGNPESPRPAARRPRRRLLLAALLLGMAALAAGLGWHLWRRPTAAEPPEIALAGADPAVVEAVEAARDRVRQEPYSIAAWGHLGRLLRATDFLPEAAACFAQAERLAPNDPRWPYLQGEALLLHGDPDAALPALRHAAELTDQQGENLLAPRLRLAEALLAAGLYDEAEAPLRRAREAAPDHPCVNLDLALLAYARDDLEGSWDLLRRCRHSPFAQKKASAQLAAVEQRLGNAAAAARASRQAATLPRDLHWSDPWVMECLRLAPGKPGRFRYVEQLEAQKRYADAAQELRELLAAGSDYPAFVWLGKNLAQLGDLAGAEEALRAAVRLAPEGVQAHYVLAKILWSQAEQAWQQGGDRTKALALYRAATDAARRAIKSKPDHALAHMLLGLCLERLGRRAEALTALRQAVEYGPDLADAHLHLGEVLAADGQAAAARPHLEQAVRLAPPEDQRPRAALARLAGGKKAE
jgi:tetratricopeptide (TPR) repeat protein